MEFLIILYIIFGIANAIIFFDREDLGKEVFLLVVLWPLILIAIAVDIMAETFLIIYRFFTEDLD